MIRTVLVDDEQPDDLTVVTLEARRRRRDRLGCAGYGLVGLIV